MRMVFYFYPQKWHPFSNNTLILLPWILNPSKDFNETEFLNKMMNEFKKLGAKTPKLRVENITELHRTKLGKVITIQALKKENR